MQRNLILCALFLLTGWQAQAQTEETQREVTRYPWDVSTDLLFVIDKNVVPPSVLVRRNTKTKKDRLTAYRFRLGGDYSEHLDPAPVDTGLSATSYRKTALVSFVSIGREWQKQWNQFQLFYGTDLFVRYDLEVLEYAIINGNDYYPKRKNLTVGVSPFIGMKFFIDSRISVSTEAHVDFSRYSEKTIGYVPGPDPNNIDTDTVVNDYFQINFNQPLYVLNLSYHF